MDYARQQRDPARHAVGIVFVVAVHAFVIYALMTGLARQALHLVKKPLDVAVIEEVKLPPPPPPKKIEPPKAPPPPPAFVPPPDIPTTAVASESAITQVTQAAPVAPPPPVPVVVAPPPPPKPAIRRGVKRLSGEYPEFPKEAIRKQIEKGSVVARLQIDEKGNVTEVTIVSADPPRVFDRAVIDALKDWKFSAEGEKYVAEIEIGFKLQ
jgi:periplasmic protein TonB